MVCLCSRESALFVFALSLHSLLCVYVRVCAPIALRRRKMYSPVMREILPIVVAGTKVADLQLKKSKYVVLLRCGWGGGGGRNVGCGVGGV
jgi:hypothetical protein